jgi:hypothetical protein
MILADYSKRFSNNNCALQNLFAYRFNSQSFFAIVAEKVFCFISNEMLLYEKNCNEIKKETFVD